MLRKIDSASNNAIRKLLYKIKDGVVSMLSDYSKLYNDEEIKLLTDITILIEDEIKNVESNNIDYQRINKILTYEDNLKPLAFRCWSSEVTNGNEFISWYKYDRLGNLSPVVSSTFGDDDSFCNSRYGTSFIVDIEGFLGACNKDAATLIETADKQSIYTIGKTAEGKVINSYNFATPIITPKQVFDKSDNTYMSKHNEIILDSRYIKPKSVIYTDENDIEIVKQISQRFNIPIEFKQKGYTK